MTPVLGTPHAWALAAILTAAWIVLACLGTAGYSAVMGKLKSRKPQRLAPPEYPPPVPPPTTPPFTQTVPSADWFYDIPADCLSDDAIRVLSDAIEANFRVIGGAS